MDVQKIKTRTERETMNVAKKLALLLAPGDVITLEGELGSGKTVFAKGIAKGLGVRGAVTSPTFTIVKEYEGELPLYHMDAYRLEHSDEDIGFDEYFFGQGISVIEWAQFIDDYLPQERLNVHIQYVNEHTRSITFTPKGKHYEDIVKQLVR